MQLAGGGRGRPPPYFLKGAGALLFRELKFTEHKKLAKLHNLFSERFKMENLITRFSSLIILGKIGNSPFYLDSLAGRRAGKEPELKYKIKLNFNLIHREVFLSIKA